MCVDFDVRQQEMDFFTGGSVIMDYGLILELKMSWWICFSFCLQDFNCWTGVVWIVMFLSAVWTLILTAPIHCRASTAEQVMQCYISPNLMKKQTHLHLGWSEGDKFSSMALYLFLYKCVHLILADKNDQIFLLCSICFSNFNSCCICAK